MGILGLRGVGFRRYTELWYMVWALGVCRVRGLRVMSVWAPISSTIQKDTQVNVRFRA